MTGPVQIMAVPGVPDIAPGDNLAAILGDVLDTGAARPADGDVLCIAHKVFSKAEGRVVDLAAVTPSAEAMDLAGRLNKDPAKVEVILGQSRRVVRSFRHPGQKEGTIICEHRLGFISANAGVDESNVGDTGTVITLPDDPDASARALGVALETRFGCALGVVMTDTFGRPWRLGQVNVAIGLYRVPARQSEIGGCDAWGRPLLVTEPAIADELAAASGLVVRKAAKTPLVLVRGVQWRPENSSSARDILRAEREDAFR